MFLAKNTTSHIEPLDQGIINCFQTIAENCSCPLLHHPPTYRHSWKKSQSKMPSTRGRAWNNVNPQTVNNYWTKGLNWPSLSTPCAACSCQRCRRLPRIHGHWCSRDWDALRARGFDVNLSPANLDVWLTIDNDVPKSHLLSDSEIVASVHLHQNQTLNQRKTLYGSLCHK